MDHAHRKIELHSSADLQYLIANSSSAARAKIDLHFPPPAVDADASAIAPLDDPLRQRVEQLVQAFLERTWAGAKQNVTVNGLEGEDMEREIGEMGQETEAFDHGLARRVQGVTGQIEALTLALANLRREIPGRTAVRYEETLKEEEERHARELEAALDADRARGEDVQLALEGLGDVEELKKAWELGTKRLLEVKDRVGGVQARLERARDAVEYLAAA